ncbi:hypothetical protein B0J11DRAFT_513211 [Dendryphion nanum]|uniref:polynucleotide adenylyltransferase n=1 Tax=Dendryphion nanum TaxID=256645 RepID=A0A9P9EEH4_9PLEO|nr:hypothetical protein B0J11DRAFT_513211 [Dendryphion nanum]
MAEMNEPTPSQITTNSYDTALCVIPTEEQCQNIDRLRSLYDKAHGRWPPHINIIYPFVSPEHLVLAKSRIQDEFFSFEMQGDLQTRLDKAGYFAHRTNNTIFLKEGSDNSALRQIRDKALYAIGQSNTSYNFHLTIGQSEDQTDSSRDFLLAKANLFPAMEFSVRTLAILIRERDQDGNTSNSFMRLWGTIDVASSLAPKLTPIREFWLSAPHPHELDADFGQEDFTTTESNFSTVPREAQACFTYQFNPSTSSWTTCREHHAGHPPTSITIASYNVLINSEYPPARDRDPLLLQAILSHNGMADILVLQEVSDDFLSYLLSSEKIQSQYPFVSNGPPSQLNLGPLPSLRNVVILSNWSFEWKLLPFHRRHKAAVIATFDIRANNDDKGLQFVVAGIHLTCGLTDGSIAAKKMQLHSLKAYLARNASDMPWIIAGDFNLTTSTYTLQTALKNKSISQQSVATLSDIESSLTEASFLDAWTVTRLEGMDGMGPVCSEDLFEGEDGATFNPMNNVLAAATSGTSNNRPQRYDRILVQPHNNLRVRKFNYFGVPEIHFGTHVVPSDHFGIRACVEILDPSEDDNSTQSAILKRYLVQTKHLRGALGDSSALVSTLSEHGMLPTDEDIEARRTAFTLIKEILLGTSDDEHSATSDIPMVLVPVGSYALGVWTSASDIDCLCIGSISSKIFFKLARQRILRAEHLGIRLLRKVEAASGTMFEISVNKVSMDLQYCPAARIVERWVEIADLHHSDIIFNLSMLSLRKLKPYRDITYIQRTLPALSTFRLAYRCIKLWAVQRGIYSSKFGYFGGVHITLMLSWIHKRLAHDHGSVSAATLVSTFFHHYAKFDWKNDLVFDAFFHKKMPRYHRTAREPMVILGFHAPNANIAHTSSVPGATTLIKELKMADERLSQEDSSWDSFFEAPDKNGAAAAAEFLRSHESYIKVQIQFWGQSLAKGKGLVGWVESRCLFHIVDIHRALPDLDVRIWPARFTDSETLESEADYQGCYLIGLSRNCDLMTYSTKEEKFLAKKTIHQSMGRLLTQLQADETHYDPNTSWIGISLVKSNEIKNLRLDDREWGDYVPELEPDSDDEEEDVGDLDEEALTHLPIRAHASSTTTPVSSNKLRPASDVLNRLRWDPHLDPNDYIIGYEDRFLGTKEIGIEKWKTEQTDEEFIPQHRILYFKRKGDGVLVWERRRRIDLVFGSGLGAG